MSFNVVYYNKDIYAKQEPLVVLIGIERKSKPAY
jgi:hypothetical protein